jgi:hypothetical protein
MPTANPRIQVMLDTDTGNLLTTLAATEKRSVSSLAADLIREALELHEDMALSKHGDDRFNSATEWVDHEDAWT